ncbi:hypothetical protein [Virgibacillus pantothenticus]|uniref:hypothetical protein n=1 Tax=Virgibacillus pantothenticus TaxID=1473 RepID=UPI00098647DA|nr:hypothetical protein [Virgibacillus pantothenticus]
MDLNGNSPKFTEKSPEFTIIPQVSDTSQAEKEFFLFQGQGKLRKQRTARRKRSSSYFKAKESYGIDAPYAEKSILFQEKAS